MSRPMQHAHDTFLATMRAQPRRAELSFIPTHDDAEAVSRDIAEVAFSFRQYIRAVASELAAQGGDVSVEGYVQEITSIFVGLTEDALQVGLVSEDREQSRIDDMKTDLMRERA